MNYTRSLRSVFEGEKCWFTALIGAVSFFVPVLGMMVFMGYLTVMIEKFHEEGDDYWEAFDFDRLEEYLTRGIWPFLANFIVSLILAMILVPVFILIFLGFPLLGGLLSGIFDAQGPILPMIMFTSFILSFVLQIALQILIMLIQVPVQIGGALGKALPPGLSITFIKDFISKVWAETIVSMLFFVLVSILLGLVGFMLCIVGIYPAVALALMCQWHLFWQLYELYLERGGTPVVPQKG